MIKKFFINILVILCFLITSHSFAEVKPTYLQSSASNVDMPSGIALSADGKKIFMTSYANANFSQYSLTKAFDISTIDTSTVVTLNLGAGGDGLNTAANKVQGFSFNNDGTKVFAIDQDGKLNSHTLSTPYDISNATQDADDGLVWDNNSTIYTTHGEDLEPHDITFNNDGTKLYLFDYDGFEVVVEYHLSTPYLTSSASLGNVFDLDDVNTTFLQDLRFDDDGTRMYLIDTGTSHGAWNFYVYKLSTGFDTSTAKYVGKLTNFFDASGGQGTPLGLHFSKDGMKLYQVTYRGDSANKIHEYNLICPYGIVICENDNDAIVSSQIDTAKNIITNNTSYIFKRFDWIKRNDKNGNFNSNNININVHNPILASLKNKLQASLKNNKKNNTSDWSLWTHGDISIGRVGDKNSSTPREVEVYGIMLGADKKLNNNKIMGAALRYGNDKIDLETNPVDEINTNSLSLNLYGTLISNEKINFNMVLGISALRIDQLSSGNITGERNGKQIFTGLNLLSNKSAGNSKLTPTAKFEFGITELSEYTDFGFVGNPGDIIYDKLTFETGNVSMGVKYNDLENYSNNNINFNGSLEYINDFTSDIDYKMRNTVDNISVINTVQRHSTHNLKANIGFERLFDNNKTFSVNYERLQGLSESSYQDSLFIKFSTARENDEEFSFNLNPLEEGLAMLEYKKPMDLFDLKVNSDYKLNGKIPYYNLNLLISNSF